jgi:acetyl/propionyl-CoA carboxylase alpha subunit
MPTPGTVRVWAAPVASHLRVETACYPGWTIPPYYDSLLAKVIAHAPTRAEAIQALARGLAAFEIVGVESNLDLLLATIQTPAFVAGHLHTGFLGEQTPSGEPPPEALAGAAVCRFRAEPPEGPWRLGRLDQPVRLDASGATYEVLVTHDPEGTQARVRVADRELSAEALGQRRARVGGELARVGPGWVEWRRRLYRVRPAPPPRIEDFAHATSAAGGGGLTAPMPGRVVKVAVARGDHVATNQPLVVLEAMKMEHVVEAPHAGVVSQVCVEPGQQVSAGELLLELGKLEGLIG